MRARSWRLRLSSAGRLHECATCRRGIVVLWCIARVLTSVILRSLFSLYSRPSVPLPSLLSLSLVPSYRFSLMYSFSSASKGLFSDDFRTASFRVASKDLTPQQKQHNADLQQQIVELEHEIAALRAAKYQLCHAIPNVILAAATRLKACTKERLDILVHFGYSTANIHNGKKNNAHTAMEHFLQHLPLDVSAANIRGMHVTRSGAMQ